MSNNRSRARRAGRNNASSEDTKCILRVLVFFVFVVAEALLLTVGYTFRPITLFGMFLVRVSYHRTVPMAATMAAIKD